jgi:amidase
MTTGLHLPATVVPAGLTDAGLPVGIMVVGSYLDDWTTLWIARLIEDVLGTRLVPPALESSVLERDRGFTIQGASREN